MAAPAGDVVTQGGQLGLGEDLLKAQINIQAFTTQGPGEEKFGFELGGRDVLAREEIGGFLQNFEDGGHEWGAI